MKIKADRIEMLAHKWLNKTITLAEVQEFDNWYRQDLDKPVNIPEALASSDDELQKRMLTVIQTSMSWRKPIQLWPRIVAAAAVLIFISIGFYFYQQSRTERSTMFATDVASGGNKAVLILADGKRIVLTDAKNGKLAEQSGVEISKSADGQLIYRITGLATTSPGKTTYNIIETPNGGQYQILLPDGTRVWLNAASSLRYPSSFVSLVNRPVELLRGEAYFEVAKDKTHPFIVKSIHQKVEVLGTHFNINSYQDEPSVKTTLLEGSVRVTGDDHALVNLKPGQQSSLSPAGIRVETVETEDAILWKNGKFSFKSESMGAVMRQLARWYDVDIVYLDEIQQVKVTGSVSRFDNISRLLEKLEQTGLVRFKIEGKKLIVMKPDGK